MLIGVAVGPSSDQSSVDGGTMWFSLPRIVKNVLGAFFSSSIFSMRSCNATPNELTENCAVLDVAVFSAGCVNPSLITEHANLVQRPVI